MEKSGILLVFKSGNHDLAINCILSDHATLPKNFNNHNMGKDHILLII